MSHDARADVQYNAINFGEQHGMLFGLAAYIPVIPDHERNPSIELITELQAAGVLIVTSHSVVVTLSIQHH